MEWERKGAALRGEFENLEMKIGALWKNRIENDIKVFHFVIVSLFKGTLCLMRGKLALTSKSILFHLFYRLPEGLTPISFLSQSLPADRSSLLEYPVLSFLVSLLLLSGIMDFNMVFLDAIFVRNVGQHT